MPAPTGPKLRARRMALGVSIEQLAEASGIPREYLEALETDARQGIPPSYADRYARAAMRHLDRFAALGDEALTVHTDPTTFSDVVVSLPTRDGDDGPPSGDAVVTTRPLTDVDDQAPARLGLARGVAITAVFAFLCVVLWDVGQTLRAARAAPASQAEQPVVVKVKLTRSARLRIDIDGTRREDRVFAGAESASFVGAREVALEVPDIDAVMVWMDGRRIRPMGRTGRSRTLRFTRGGGEGS